MHLLLTAVTTTTTTPGFANNMYSTPVDYGVSNPGHVYDELNTASPGTMPGNVYYITVQPLHQASLTTRVPRP